MNTDATRSRAYGKPLALLVAASVGFALLLSGPVASARAHHNPTGFYAAGLARCQSNQIFVHQPEISEAYPQGKAQLVAIRTHLAKWIPNVGWRTVMSDVWKRAWKTNATTGGYSWTTLDGRSISPTSTFPVLEVGTFQAPVYYAVYTEYYWYADEIRHSGSTWSFNPHQEDRGSYADQSTYGWCKYPGPNWLTIVG